MQYYDYLQKALNTAAKYHEGQKRKGIEYPYIVHPVAVAIILSKYSDDCNLLAAGFLHDFFEDVDPKVYGPFEMNRDFNNEVVRIVNEVTEKKEHGMSREEEKRTWKSRKMKYLKKLEGDSKEGLMVCAADKIHNLHALLEYYAEKRDEIWPDFNGGKKGTIWFYTEVLKVLKARLDSPIVKQLEDVYEIFMKNMEEPKDFFLGMVEMSNAKGFEMRVYLVNPTKDRYSVREILASFGDTDCGLMDLGSAECPEFILEPRGWHEIDMFNDEGQLDFMTAYNLRFQKIDGRGRKVGKRRTMLGHVNGWRFYFPDFQGLMPVIGRKGVIEELRPLRVE